MISLKIISSSKADDISSLCFSVNLKATYIHLFASNTTTFGYCGATQMIKSTDGFFNLKRQGSSQTYAFGK
jgi:hypothetical protein